MKAFGFLFVGICVLSCNDQPKIRQSVAEAFGGAALDTLDSLSFRINAVRYNDGDSTFSSHQYELSLDNGFIKESTDTASSDFLLSRDIILQDSVYVFSSPSARTLFEKLFYNFLYLMDEKHAKWKEIGAIVYDNKNCRIVEVSDVYNLLAPIHLFIDEQTHLIVTSSIPAEGKYVYFADESDYQVISCLGIRFPVTFTIIRNGMVKMRGHFADFCSK